MYTCLSHDVVAHETAHAVLDGLRHRFLEPGLPDQAAFHEGFADVVALLSVFSLPAVVEVCLGPDNAEGRISRKAVTADQLRRSVLTGVAEQLGDVLTQGRGALRQSALDPPPPGWDQDPAYAEPHARGQVLVAVVLDVLIDIWTQRLEPLLAPESGRSPRTIDRARAAEEGAKAAGHLLTMLIRGLDYLPPVEFEFGDFVDAVTLADKEVEPDDNLGYRDKLVDRFARSGIVAPPGTSHDLLSGDFVPRYHGMNFTAMRTDADEVFRFMWQNAAQLEIDTGYYTHVESVRPSQRVGPDGLIVTESVANYVQMLEMTAGELQPRLPRAATARRHGPVHAGAAARGRHSGVRPVRPRQTAPVQAARRLGPSAAASGLPAPLRLLQPPREARVLQPGAARPGVRRTPQHRLRLRGGLVNAAPTPVRVRVRMYQVGFGDAILLSVEYDHPDADGRSERHILFDCGTTRAPSGEDAATMTTVAELVAQHTHGQLDVLVVTHRHKDHLYGFGVPAAAQTLAALAPRLVLRPWTEDPTLTDDGPGPAPPSGATVKARAFTQQLAAAQQAADLLARQPAPHAGALHDLQAAAAGQQPNAEALATLEAMSANRRGRYLHAGSEVDLDRVVPGMRLTVLGPPTIAQAPKVAGQVSRDPEYWMLRLQRSLSYAAAPHQAADRGGHRIRQFTHPGRCRTCVTSRVGAGPGPLAGRETRQPPHPLGDTPGPRTRRRPQQHQPAAAARGRRAHPAVPRRRPDRELAVHPRPARR